MSIFNQRFSSIAGCLPTHVIFHKRLLSNEGPPPLKVVYRWGSSSFKGCPRSKGVFYQSLPSMEGCLPFKDVFYWRWSSNEGHLLLEGSSIKSHLSSYRLSSRHQGRIVWDIGSKFCPGPTYHSSEIQYDYFIYFVHKTWYNVLSR